MRDDIGVDAPGLGGELETQRKATGSGIGGVIWDVREAGGCSALREFQKAQK